MGRGTADLAEKRIACRLFATAHFVGNADCLLNGAYLPLDLLKVIAREAELI